MLLLLIGQLHILYPDTTSAMAAYKGYRKALSLFKLKEIPFYFRGPTPMGVGGYVDSVVNVHKQERGGWRTYYNIGLHEGLHLLRIGEVYVQALTAKYALDDTISALSKSSALYYLKNGPLERALSLPLGTLWNGDSIEALIRRGIPLREDTLPYTIGEGLMYVVDNPEERKNIFPCLHSPLPIGRREKVRIGSYLVGLGEERGDDVDKNIWEALNTIRRDCYGTAPKP